MTTIKQLIPLLFIILCSCSMTEDLSLETEGEITSATIILSDTDYSVGDSIKAEIDYKTTKPIDKTEITYTWEVLQDGNLLETITDIDILTYIPQNPGTYQLNLKIEHNNQIISTTIYVIFIDPQAEKLAKYQDNLPGYYVGTSITKWNDTTPIAFIINDDGSYSAYATIQSDYAALQYGTDEDSDFKKISLIDITASYTASGEIVLAWSSGSSTTANLRNLIFSESFDTLSFDIWNGDKGPLEIDLQRIKQEDLPPSPYDCLPFPEDSLLIPIFLNKKVEGNIENRTKRYSVVLDSGVNYVLLSASVGEQTHVVKTSIYDNLNCWIKNGAEHPTISAGYLTFCPKTSGEYLIYLKDIYKVNTRGFLKVIEYEPGSNVGGQGFDWDWNEILGDEEVITDTFQTLLVGSKVESYCAVQDSTLWYKMDLDSGKTYKVEAKGSSIYVIDVELSMVESNSIKVLLVNNNPTWEGAPAQLIFKVNTSGKYLLSATTHRDEAWEMSLSESNYVQIEEDNFEPDNSPDLASLITINDSQERTLTVGDVDYIKVNLETDKHYHLTAYAGISAKILLLDENMVMIEEFIHWSMVPPDFRFKSPGKGTYYFQVTDNNNEAGTYTFTFN